MSRQAGQPDLHVNPAAERNKGPILEVLERVLPRQGLVLECASGAGHHVAHFAAALPTLRWQPSEADPGLCEAIAARTADLANVAEPLPLDVTQAAWPIERADAMLCINLTHISPWAATLALLDNAGRLLPPGAPLLLYGPFRVDGAHTAESNARFDASLRARNAAWGLRELEDVERVAVASKLEPLERVLMPANNFCVLFRRR